MRKRWKQPKIYRPNEVKGKDYFWFRITNSYGKKQVFKFDTYIKARNKLGELHNNFLNSLYNKPIQRIEIESAIDFHLKGKQDLRVVKRYYDYKRNFLGFVNEKGFKFIDELTSELIQEYMLWRKNYGMRESKQGCCK